MKIYDSNLIPLFEEWEFSRGIANAAAMALHNALKSENQDREMLFLLKKAMEDTHEKSMDIFDRLQKSRLDNK